jgi:hypothetical protein
VKLAIRTIYRNGRCFVGGAIMQYLKIVFVGLLCLPLLYLSIRFVGKLLDGMIESKKKAGM